MFSYQNTVIRSLVAVAAVSLAAAAIAYPQTDPRTRVVITDNVKSTVSKTPKHPMSIEELRSKITIAIAEPALKRGQIGIKIMSLDSGQTIYERNAENYFIPASNMKSFTVAAALENLGPDYRFLTSVYARSAPGPEGTVNGDLIIFGRGDPSFSGTFNGGDPYTAMDELAERILKAGVKRIEGDIVGDESYFNTNAIPVGWEWDDLQWYYGAEVSALSVNDNAVELKISPAKPGEPCSVSIKPGTRIVRIVNRTVTAPKGSTKTLAVTKKLGDNLLEITGEIPEGDVGFSGNVAVSDPASYFADLLRQRLELKGVDVNGSSRSAGRNDRGGAPLNTSELVEIASRPSPPLRLIAEKTMKPSQNLYTELLLRVLGETKGERADKSKSSEQKGIELVRSLLTQAGADPESVVQYDGSGLSRHNLITPNASMMLYKFMDSSRYADAWKNSLTVGAVDGTLRRRFTGTSASANVRGKTGTLDQVSALSGYVTSKSGERFVFSIITNYIPSSRLRIQTIDSIVVLLSDFDGHTVQPPDSSVPAKN